VHDATRSPPPPKPPSFYLPYATFTATATAGLAAPAAEAPPTKFNPEAYETSDAPSEVAARAQAKAKKEHEVGVVGGCAVGAAAVMLLAMRLCGTRSAGSAGQRAGKGEGAPLLPVGRRAGWGAAAAARERL